MSVIGIVSEYNPFHSGHEFHISESRRAVGGDSTAVCVMSGDFVQRGEAAVYPKTVRAEAALRCGADLVIELPLPWCIASAEGFARGAVETLAALGQVTHISFGSECGDIEELSRLSEALLSAEFTSALKKKLAAGEGQPFARLRQQALAELCGESAELLSSPNNILGVEYIKAVRSLRADIAPMTVKRRGSEHDGTGSASELRGLIRSGVSIESFIPQAAAEVFAGIPIINSDTLDAVLLSRLRTMTEQDFAVLPDVSEGMENRLAEASRRAGSLDELYDSVKSKRYAMSRIRRIVLCAALGVTREMQSAPVPYIRVLAANERGRALLHEARSTATLPIITKPASVNGMGGCCEKVFSLCADAHDAYVLGYASRMLRRGGEDWKTTPFIL